MLRSLSEPERFGAIFDRHFAAIHAYVSRRLGRSRADDLVGDVFRIAFEVRGSFDATRGTARAWLYGIANNVIRQHLRADERAERTWRRLSPPAELTDEALDDRLDARLVVARLQQALDRLLPDDREALILFAVEGLSYAEIATVMNSPIGTVRSRLSRARSQTQQSLDVLAPARLEPEINHGRTHTSSRLLPRRPTRPGTRHR